MLCGKNKEALVELLFEQWKSLAKDELEGHELYVTHGNKCHRICYSVTLQIVCEVTRNNKCFIKNILDFATYTVEIHQ